MKLRFRSLVILFAALSTASPLLSEQGTQAPDRVVASAIGLNPSSGRERQAVPLQNGTKWVIACEAEATEKAANAAADQWRTRGFSSGTFWIPDYSSLSGAKLWLVFVGWYDGSQKDEARVTLKEVKRFYPKAYGIKVDNSGRRETF